MLTHRSIPFLPALHPIPSFSKKGLILNMGSFAGAAPTPMLAIYSASKSFLRTWSEGLAAELTPKGVTIEHVNTYYVVRRRVSPSPLSCINQRKTLTHADFRNVENPPPVPVHSHSKSLCARRAREDRTWHRHALLDPCAGQRSHGARAIQDGADIHARSAQGYEETCVSKKGQACKARIDPCLTMSIILLSVRNVFMSYSSTFTRQNTSPYCYPSSLMEHAGQYEEANRTTMMNIKAQLRGH